MPPIPFETGPSLDFKLTLIEMYMQRLAKRREAKALMFDRGLLEYKKVRKSSHDGRRIEAFPVASRGEKTSERRERHHSSIAAVCKITNRGGL